MFTRNLCNIRHIASYAVPVLASHGLYRKLDQYNEIKDKNDIVTSNLDPILCGFLFAAASMNHVWLFPYHFYMDRMERCEHRPCKLNDSNDVFKFLYF